MANLQEPNGIAQDISALLLPLNARQHARIILVKRSNEELETLEQAYYAGAGRNITSLAQSASQTMQIASGWLLMNGALYGWNLDPNLLMFYQRASHLRQ